MNSNPPCCPPDSLPFLPEDKNYVIKGNMIELNDFSMYVVGSGTNVIVMAPDLFGIHSGHHKRLCDQLAEALPSTIVCLPDFLVPMGSSAIPPDAGIWFWFTCILSILCCGELQKIFTKLSWANSSKKIFESAVDFLNDKNSIAGIGVIGFCWGTYVVAKACSNDNKYAHLMRGGVSAHSSTDRASEGCNEDRQLIISNICCPQLILSSKDESDSWQPNGFAIKTIQQKFPNSAAYSYPKQSHGWYARGDLTKPQIAADVNDALNKTIVFFRNVFAPGTEGN